MIKTITIDTSKYNEIVDITSEVRKIVEESKVKNGYCIIFSKHTSAGVTINENDDPCVKEDILSFLNSIVPKGVWKHDKSGRCDRNGNTNAHLKTSIVGHHKMVPVENWELSIGRWQGIWFCEFDGPRSGRKVTVSVIKDNQ